MLARKLIVYELLKRENDIKRKRFLVQQIFMKKHLQGNFNVFWLRN